jgi:hypothetical protein
MTRTPNHGELLLLTPNEEGSYTPSDATDTERWGPLTDLTARLAPGDPVEIAWLTNQGTRIEHGRFERIGHDAFGDEAVFYRRAGRSWDVPRTALRYVSPVDPSTIAGSYRPGDRAIVTKYASDYTGTVVNVARTRLTVRIVLGAGTSRERERDLAVNALDVRRPRKDVLL